MKKKEKALMYLFVLALFCVVGIAVHRKNSMEGQKMREKEPESEQEQVDDRMLKRLIIEESSQDGMKKYIFEFGKFEQIAAEEFYSLGLFDFSLLKKGGNILKEIKYEYDEEGEECKTMEYISKYDDQGRLLRIDYNLIYSQTYTEYEYDEEGRMIKKTDSGENVTNYEYDEKGNLLKRSGSYAGSVENKVEYKYDEYGNVIDETVYKFGSVSYAREYRYTPGTDKVVEMINYGANRGYIGREEYIYDGEDKLIQELGFDEHENPTSVEYEYDEAGNLLKEVAYKGKNREEISKREYEYNEENLVTREVYYDWNSDGSKTYEYDDTGDVVVKTYFDKEGNMTRQWKYQYEYYDDDFEKEKHHEQK